ncbi:HD domain-containing phosphohydrolase [Limnohabitans sp. JirII-31]|uniref:HD domain-containing phosphohydrolase n=1 Tax=Limnohabitans sp. JirII-31 TaxID=1977908 RepID=UPI000C1E036C|nr:HD domain-containing phosphohydrolase [Limnohabitans sp. JirII-31]PIT72874.1 metal-dependent phosphohydrolase [Limnohabitans sp. JirII-31]
MTTDKSLGHLGISDSVDRRNELEMLNWALLAQNKAASALSRADDKDSLLKEVCQSIVEQKPYELAWVGFAQHDAEKSVFIAAAEGAAKKYVTQIQVSWSADSPFGAGPAGTCLRTGTASLFKDCTRDAGFSAWSERAASFGLRSVVAVPIFDGELPAIATLLVYASVPNAFGDKELLLFESLAKVIGTGLRNLERQGRLANEVQKREETQQRLADALRATIEAVSKTMEWRDPYTAGHQRRVAQIAVAIARKLGWTSEKIEGLYLAAMVHDIGKVGVPSEILTKPMRLTSVETQLVREHAETGYQILKDIPFPWPIAEMVRQHHERMDGTGYPKGLSAPQILDEAKVIGVADTLEAMGSHRPYRPALGLAAAIDVITSESGTAYDPAIVQAACSLMDAQNTLQSILDK